MARRTATRALSGSPGPITVSVPDKWSKRSYQVELMTVMPASTTPGVVKKDRFVLVWHRKAGKDLTALAMTVREMVSRIGYYVHILPNLNQARTILWDGKDNAGIPFLWRFPEALIKERNETELQIVLKPLPGQLGYGKPGAQGSIWQLRGADEPSRLRGPNYVGAVFSEYSEMKDDVWPIMQPAIEASKGWALFNFTPKGRNHAHKIYEMARDDPRWYCKLLTVDDTKEDAVGESGNRIVSVEQIEQMRKEGVPEHIIQQEYYCSFSGFLHGTIYGDLMSQARKDGRITRAPYSSAYPVGTCWDIGRTDATAIWFYQRIGQTIYFVDYLEDTLKGADYYAKRLRELPYMFSRHILPHDARAKNFAATQSVEEFFQNTLGYRQVKVAERTPVQQGIDATRRMFSRFVFDETKCARGIECLEKYARRWNDQMRDYSGEPQHDEWSHGSDALRTGVQGGIDEALDFFGQESQIGSPEKQETYFPIFDEERGMIQ